MRRRAPNAGSAPGRRSVIVWLVVVAVVVVFALVNTKKVDVDWVVSDSRAPLWVVIGASAVAGAIIGFVARPRRS